MEFHHVVLCCCSMNLVGQLSRRTILHRPRKMMHTSSSSLLCCRNMSREQMCPLIDIVDSLNDRTHLNDFIPFISGGEEIGLVCKKFVGLCGDYFQAEQLLFDTDKTSFVFKNDDASSQEKTAILNTLSTTLHKDGIIKGWRNELFPVSNTFPCLNYTSTSSNNNNTILIERAAYPFFGVKAYGIHINGYVRDPQSGQISGLWIGKRSKSKSTWPGAYDHIVAGAQPYGLSLRQNIIKECAEEANIPQSLAETAVAVGTISYTARETDIQSFGDSAQYMLRRDTIYAYDLEIPSGFIPVPSDGEVESFQLKSIDWVLERMIMTGRSLSKDMSAGNEYGIEGNGPVNGGSAGGTCDKERVNDGDEDSSLFKPNCCLVIMDFLLRHGFIDPQSPGCTELVGKLRNNGKYSG